MNKHIAIFGGSFDPPHMGHFSLVQTALEHLKIDELWLLPVGTPVHRQLSGKATSQQRLGWLQDMFSAEERLKIKDWEINNPNPTPAIDTLRRFQKENPHLVPTWLMGMDSFLDLPNWIGFPQHRTLCNLAVFQRKGIESGNISNTWDTVNLSEWQTNPPHKAGHIVHLGIDLPDISSTRIRQNASANKHLLAQSNCNAILACYASDLMNPEREDT